MQTVNYLGVHLSYSIASLFPRPSLTFLVGTFGSKKTWLALDLAVCAATGQPWLDTAPSPRLGEDRPPCGGRGEGVLFLDNELGLSAFRHRLRSVLEAHHAPSDIPLHFACFPDVDLACQPDTDALAARLLSLNVQLLIIDRLVSARQLDGGRGTLLHTLQPLLANLRRLADQTNAAVLVLQHTRHRRTPLPQTLVAMGADHVLGVDSPYVQPQAHIRTLASVSSPPVSITTSIIIRQLKRGKIMQDPEFSGSQPSHQLPQPPLGPAGLSLLAYLTTIESATIRQLMALRSIASPGRIHNLVFELLNQGYLQCVRPGKHGSPGQYALTPAGRNVANVHL